MPAQTRTPSTSDPDANGVEPERVTLVVTVPEYRELSKMLQQISLAGVKLFSQNHPNYTILKGLFNSMLEQEARREVDARKLAIQATEQGAAGERRVRVQGSQASTPQARTNQEGPPGPAHEPEVELVVREQKSPGNPPAQPQKRQNQQTGNQHPQRPAKKASHKKASHNQNRQSKKGPKKKGRRRR